MSDGGSVVSSSSGKSAKKYTSFEDWCDQNPSLFQFLDQLQIRNKISQTQFQTKRQGTHNRCTDALLTQIKKIETKLNLLQQDITNLSLVPYPVVGFIGYEDNRQNLEVRKHSFICRTIQIKEIDVLSKKYGILSDLINDNKQMMRLFTSDILPKNQIFRIKETFFEIHLSDVIFQEEKRIQRLKAFEKKLASEITHFKKPSWHKNFSQFLADISQKGVSHLDRDISYFTYLEEEISLSRALFGPSSRMRSQIDEILRSELKTSDLPEFLVSIMESCESLIPPQLTDVDQQSACILLLFRAFFNRFYEKFPSEFAPKTPFEDIKKIEKLRTLPASLFTIPRELVGSEPNGTIEQFFRSDPFFFAASQFLSLSIFMSNPIDVLYYIHKCLLGIQKGALIHRIGPGANAKMEDVKTLLCFDDLFSLFVGALMASDLPDIFFVSDFISRYSPKSSLSPPFEYALANTEALVAHCNKLDYDELSSKTEDMK